MVRSQVEAVSDYIIEIIGRASAHSDPYARCGSSWVAAAGIDYHAVTVRAGSAALGA
jgi:hypothetical protein